MISISMTSYNGEKYIIQQLDSIRNQTIEPDEVIIVDDYSTDNTLELIKSYVKKYNLKNWNIYQNPYNKGYIYSFRKSIALTKGDIIFLCDQDDVWDLNKLEVMQKTFNANPNILVLNTSFRRIDSNDNPINVKRRPFSSNNNLIRKSISANKCVNISFNEVSTYNISPGCTAAFRDKLKGEFLNIDLVLPHDWTINLIASCYNGLYFLNTPLISYRIHENNTIGLTRQYSKENRLELCTSGLLERQEMKKFVKTLASKDKDTYIEYLDRLIGIFSRRKTNLEKCNLLGAINVLLISFNMNGFSDSCIVDILSILKRS